MSYGILPNGKQQFIDSNGNPLAGGKVYYYIPSTTTFKNTYQDDAGSSLNTNPVVLDASGQCIAYGTGSYRQQVFDVNGNLIWDQQVDTPMTSSNQTYDIQEQTFLATAGQTQFNLTTMYYAPGTNNLTVFVNGLKQIVNTNYIENSSTQITFTTGLNVGAIVDFTTAVINTSASTFSSALVTYNEGGTGAVTTTVQAKLRQVVSVVDFIRLSDIGTTNDVAYAFNAALTASSTVIVPAGTYYISSPIFMSGTQQKLYGVGKGSSEIIAKTGFTGATVGGSTGSPMIWVQPPGTYNENSNWVQGGEISALTIYGNSAASEGIRLNRVVEAMTVKEVEIVGCGIGVNGTGFGWCTSFINCYIHDNSIVSVRLSGAYNGTTFVDCFLYGGNLTTQVHLDIIGDSTYLPIPYGNFGLAMTGGAIEGCEVGVRLIYSSIAFSGVDFEVCSKNFIQSTGIYSGATLNFASPPITVTGCTFVGVPASGVAPYIGGIVVRGGQATVIGCFFINQGAAPTVYALNGLATGTGVINGPAPCIVSMGNDFNGWSTFSITGVVFNNALTDYQTNSWTPVLTGFTTTGGVSINRAIYTKIGNLVSFTFDVIATTIATTNATITGLPFVPSANSVINMDSGATIPSGSGYVYTSGTVALPNNAAWGNQVIITGSYFTAS